MENVTPSCRLYVGYRDFDDLVLTLSYTIDMYTSSYPALRGMTLSLREIESGHARLQYQYMLLALSEMVLTVPSRVNSVANSEHTWME